MRELRAISAERALGSEAGCPIVLTVSGRTPVSPGLGSQAGYTGIPHRYVAEVDACGAVLAMVGSDSRIPPVRLLEGVGGLLLIGGGDIDPSSYGREALKKIYGVDRRRDRLELELVRGAFALNLPVLGICRGLQVINVARGGTLLQGAEDSVVHGEPQSATFVSNTISVTADSLLATITGRSALKRCACAHHQAVAELGEGLTVSAIAEDGWIEGIEAPSRRFVLGVQWHPEVTAADCHGQHQIVEAFVAACRETLKEGGQAERKNSSVRAKARQNLRAEPRQAPLAYCED